MLESGIITKSSYSTVQCVLATMHPDGDVEVSDSKDRTRDPLVYTRDEWVAFIAGVKAGEFDHPHTSTKMSARR